MVGPATRCVTLHRPTPPSKTPPRAPAPPRAQRYSRGLQMIDTESTNAAAPPLIPVTTYPFGQRRS